MKVEDIINAVDAWGKTTDHSQVRTQLSKLYDKLKKEDISRNLIENIEGAGYRLSTHPDNITIE